MEEFEIEFEDDYVEPKRNSNPMPENEPTSIPSFLVDEKKNDQFDNPVKDDDFSFNNIPSMEAPEIKFDNNNQANYYNPAVDRNLTVEEAMKLSQNGTRIPAKEEDLKKAGIPTGNINNEDVSVFSSQNEGRPATRPHYEERVEPKPAPQQTFETKPEPKPIQKEAPAPKASQKSVDYSKYSIPYKKLFPKSTSERDMHPQWLEDKKEIINQTLKAFGIDGEVIDYTKGPAFTLYEIMLAPGVNVKKVGQIHDNLQMNLQVPSIRILLPIPGKNTIGVEAPNDKADVVKFGDILSDEFVYDNKGLNVALGEKIDGSPLYENIPDMPHALIAGATQSGKSVSINTILVSLLIKNSPENLRLILVDPKKVELSFYNDIPHLATPIIDDPQMAAEALKWAVEEMDRRYEVFARNRVRNLEGYNEKRKNDPELERLPYYVIIIDEFNDLIMQCANDVNYCVLRLAQKARAAGMHVILATQRPTTDVVNGTIKANFPCRIAFRVSSDVDSRVILDDVGAESLLGNGDMLIKTDQPLQRAQGAYISDDEIAAVADYLIDNYEPDFVFSHAELAKKVQQAGGVTVSRKEAEESDDLLYEIASACVQQGACSINSIQSSFGLGFNRAQRIVTMLEDRGIVSPKNGTKGREILVDIYQLNNMFGKED
jgi:S-DNA-T family DNA segregation ATPase FtsK/SpoIIIE